MKESKVHDLLLKNKEIQQDLQAILGIKEFELIHEDTYINGITVDFTLLYKQKIKALIECKAGNINVTDYVRGIGQLLQYEYFFEENISPKSFPYSEAFYAILFFPSSVIKNNAFNIGRFKYPKNTLLIELNEKSSVIRAITNKELGKLKEAKEKKLITISQYYIRDNRLYELYLLLRYVSYLKMKGVNNCDRKKVELEFLRQLETPNNKNWRNAFIALASLGFIDGNNLPTASGSRFAHLDFAEFAYELFDSYLQPYFQEVYECFEDKKIINFNNPSFCKKIQKKYQGKDVLFLTESAGRYISSWLNIMRDDFGFIDFKARSSERHLIYPLPDLNKNAAIKYIKKYSKAYDYIEKYKNLLKA
ncbi:MAG: hypothetical protein ACPG5B_12175 [Chitinophagales bacterium]